MYLYFKSLPGKIQRKIQKKFFFDERKMDKKSELINWFGSKYNYSSYLEISTYSTGNYFNEVNKNIFKVRECLNYYPMEDSLMIIKNNTIRADHKFKLSNYQSRLLEIKEKNNLFDVILVDSFHTYDQSSKDIKTALELVSANGVIIVHDCNPPEEEITGNLWVAGSWAGQTYESFIHFRKEYSHLESCVVDIDFGCGIIRCNHPPFNALNLREETDVADITKWDYFSEHRHELLNIITIEEFISHYTPNYAE